MHYLALTYLRLITLSWQLAALMIIAVVAFGAVRARFRGPTAPALVVLAAWASFLLAPGTASASVLSGSAAHGSLLGLLGAVLAFGIAVATPPIAPTPGAQTSEFQLAKYVTMFGMAMTTIGTILATVSALLPSGSKPAMYVGVAIAVVGALTKVATALGYASDRSDQKVEAIKGQATVEAAKATAAAGANAGTAASALATDLK